MSRIQYQVIIPFTNQHAAEHCLSGLNYSGFIDAVRLEQQEVEVSRERVDYD